MVWHGGVEVIEYVWAREGRVELLGTETGMF